MKRQIRWLIYILLIILMPFVAYSCESTGPNLDFTQSWGYTIGFPVEFIRIFLNPVKIDRICLVGLIDLFLIVLAAYVCGKFGKRWMLLYPHLANGIKWLLVYISIHFLFQISIPILEAHSINVLSSQVVSAAAYFILPYLLLSENFDIFHIEEISVMLRVNFTVSCLFYFLLGLKMSRLKGLIKKLFVKRGTPPC